MKLITIDISNIDKKITPVLRSQKAVAGAYLFGSALGRCRPDSDIDLGLLLQPEISYSEKETDYIVEDILEELPPVKNHVFDLIILNRTSAIFAYKVITQGKLIYSRNIETVKNFMERVSRQRAEDYPRYCQALKIIAKEC